MLGCRLSCQSPPLGLRKKKPSSPFVFIVSTHWPIAAKPALGEAANGAGALVVLFAKGASSVDGSSAPLALAADGSSTSRHARIDLRSIRCGYHGLRR